MLRFFCICGHSRGRHEDCIKDKNEVGGCNDLNCKCLKYHSDTKRNKKAENHYKVGLKILLPPITLVLLSLIFAGEIDRDFEGFAEYFFTLVFFVTFVYFTVLKPVDKLCSKIRSR